MDRVVTTAVVCACAACTAEVPIAGAACDDEIHPCPGQYECLDSICVPIIQIAGVRCRQDADCPAGVCLTGSQVCVGCIEHEDCVSNLCEKLTHICQGCKADYQCRSGYCDKRNGICAPEISTKAAALRN